MEVLFTVISYISGWNKRKIYSPVNKWLAAWIDFSGRKCNFMIGHSISTHEICLDFCQIFNIVYMYLWNWKSYYLNALVCTSDRIMCLTSMVDSWKILIIIIFRLFKILYSFSGISLPLNFVLKVWEIGKLLFFTLSMEIWILTDIINKTSVTVHCRPWISLSLGPTLSMLVSCEGNNRWAPFQNVSYLAAK